VSGELIAVLAVILVAMAFDYTNGFHDAANAIATSVSTRALTPRVALGVAALGNFAGAHLGENVAKTVGSGLVELPTGRASLGVVFAGVVGAICWNLFTWYFGIPSSSSHALFGGLVGATLFATGGDVLWHGIVGKVIIPMVASPLVGFTLGGLVMLAVMWIFRHGQPGKLNRGFRVAQSISAAAMSVGHGMQDAAKTMGIVVLALYTGGYQESTTHIPQWVFFSSATVLALGTYAGGWRIIRTLGRRVIHLGPPEGFAAETVHHVPARLSDLHDAHHHLGDHGRGRDEEALRGALGGCRQHRDGLDPHLPRRRRDRLPGVLPGPPRLLTPPPALIGLIMR
jgi:PiT family inorganic phosphate transporter